MTKVHKFGYTVPFSFEQIVGPARPGHSEPYEMTAEEKKQRKRAKELMKELEQNPWIGWSYDEGPYVMPKRTTQWAYDTNIGYNQVVEYPRIIAFSAQWKGARKVLFYSEYHNSRTEMLEALHALLDEADVVVTFNGDRFDLPWIDGEFIAEKMSPPSPVMKVDLFKVVRKHTRWLHKKLDVVSHRLLGDRKVPHQGFGLWMDCLRGDDDAKRKAWSLMRTYAKKDTALLWPLFDELKAWIKMPHPISNERGLVCRNCGGTHLQRRGVAKTLQGEYDRYQCVTCSTWNRGTTRTAVGELRSL